METNIWFNLFEMFTNDHLNYRAVRFEKLKILKNNLDLWILLFRRNLDSERFSKSLSK